jgi:amino acid transporter
MSTPALARRLGRLDIIALGINGVVGSGIFFLPSKGDAQMGPAALSATLFAGLLCLLIALCFAEVGSRFRGTGGPYLYAREAFGDFVGFQVGWMTWWVGVTSWGALANAFIMALSHFAPALTDELYYDVGILMLMVTLVLVNYRGVKWGAQLSNFFTAAKLIPLLIFVAVGAFAMSPDNFEPFAPHGYQSFADVTLIILYAYVGFESLPVPAGEMKDPERSIPLALVTVMFGVTLLYLAIQAVAIGTLDTLSAHANPLAAAATNFMGSGGGALIAVGSMISILGVNAGTTLVTPRRLYALAEHGEMPRLLAKVHPSYQTPGPAIIASALVATILALTGSFVELAMLSVVARFIQYIPTCIAVIVFRRRDSAQTGIRIPFGSAIASLACILSLGLLSQAAPEKLIAGAAAMVAGIPFFIFFKRQGQSQFGPR